MPFDPYTFDVVERDLQRHLRQIEREEMNDGELEIKVYGTDAGYGRIVLRTIEGIVYLGEDVLGTVELVKQFIEEQMRVKE